MQKAKDPLGLFIELMLRRLFSTFSWILFSPLRWFGLGALCSFFLVCATLPQCFQVGHERQFLCSTADLLAMVRPTMLLRPLPFSQAEVKVAPISLLQFSRIAIADPFSVAKQGNAADIRWVIAKIVLDSTSAMVDPFNASKL